MLRNREPIVDRLTENDPSLVKLDLTSGLRDEDFAQLQQAMSANNTVEKVVVDFQWLAESFSRSESLMLLQTVGDSMPSVEKLMIFDHGREGFAMEALASAMSVNLKALDIVRLEFLSMEDMKNFAEVIREHKSLERFSSHRLTLANGVTLDPLFEVLHALPHLKAVCLSFDWDLREPYVKSADSFSTLCKSASLQELKLWSRQLDDSCCVAIARALRVNTTLKTIDLQCQVIGNEGLEEISTMMEMNYTIENVKTGTGRRASLANKIDMYSRLNRVGRFLLVKEQASKAEWIEKLIEGIEDFDAVFYFIRSNPLLLSMDQQTR